MLSRRSIEGHVTRVWDGVLHPRVRQTIRSDELACSRRNARSESAETSSGIVHSSPDKRIVARSNGNGVRGLNDRARKRARIDHARPAKLAQPQVAHHVIRADK